VIDFQLLCTNVEEKGQEKKRKVVTTTSVKPSRRCDQEFPITNPNDTCRQIYVQVGKNIYNQSLRTGGGLWTYILGAVLAYQGKELL